MDLVALVGLAGSGKTEASNIFREHGYGYIRFGDITMDILKERGLEVNEKNERAVREGVRREYGMAAYAVLNEGKIREARELGDVVIDGGNSHFLDTEKRFNEFEKLGIHFLGVGTSGGILAEKNGYPFMVGGAIKGYEIIKPVLDSLSKPNGGYQYFGTGGAGHFVKMVHNGIEYGIMQSLGEGFEVLEKSKYNFNLLDVAKLWQKGTLVSGFMLDRAKDALEKNEKLDDIVGSIDASGEALWTIEEAKKEQVDVEIIERSLEYRIRSKKDKKIQNSFTARMVAALRREFGGHSVKEKTV